ncbi:MAG: hypothetical protein KDE14_03930 [Rhodobacteraceae bacterium]|nr:hypothetical protein [Paracoccaceae bacterium]
MKAFIGTFVNKIDAKGRVSVPAPFRAVVQAKGMNAVALYPSPTEACAEGCGMDRIDTLVDAMPDDFSPIARNNDMAEIILASARETPFDADGRVVLPEDFIAHAGLSERAAFVGKGRVFQIWDPDKLAESHAALKQRIAAQRKAASGKGGA